MAKLNVCCFCCSSIRNWRGSPLSTAQTRPTPPRLLTGRRMLRRTDIRTLFHVSASFSFATITDVDAQPESLSPCVNTLPQSTTLLTMLKSAQWLCFSTVDHSRVKLSLITSKNDTDYINANFIQVCELYCSCHSGALFFLLLLRQNNKMHQQQNN